MNLVNRPRKRLSSKKTLVVESEYSNNTHFRDQSVLEKESSHLTIPFDKTVLIDLLTEMQESNLTLMLRIQEDENNYEELQKQLNQSIRFFNKNFGHLANFNSHGKAVVAKTLDDVQKALNAAKERESQQMEENDLIKLVIIFIYSFKDYMLKYILENAKTTRRETKGRWDSSD